VERIELDVIQAKQSFIISQALQQLFLGKSPASLAGCLLALHAGTYTVDARECTITLDLALLAQHTGQRALGLGGDCLFRCRVRCRHDMELSILLRHITSYWNPVSEARVYWGKKEGKGKKSGFTKSETHTTG
jgi:hypothetical protein